MSSKSILHISLDIEESFRDYDDLDKLKELTEQNDGFIGWTFRSEIGGVYDISQNYETIFSAIDSAGDYFLPIIYNFQEIEYSNNCLSVRYVPDDIDIFINFREYMEKLGVSFLKNIDEKPYFAIDIENVNPNTVQPVINEFTPTKKEIVYNSATISKFNKNKTRIYHRTKVYKH